MAYYTNVRYGKMRMVARFKTDREDLRTRDRCVVRTDRGKEVGEVLSPLQAIPEAIPPESLWDVVRRAGPEDLQHAERLEKGGGARDEARLVGDAGHCGLELCCRGHLKELGGITMDMAKIQKHTADPSKITGRCGKLLCCLRYEYLTYTGSRDLLPPRGTRIETKKGNGVVVEQNLLLREVTIQPDDD